MPPTMRPPRLFLAGFVLITPGAQTAFTEAGEKPYDYLARHQQGDWGEVCAEDKALNDRAVKEGTRLLSAYTLNTGKTFRIITEADRSSTTFLLPEEY